MEKSLIKLESQRASCQPLITDKLVTLLPGSNRSIASFFFFFFPSSRYHETRRIIRLWDERIGRTRAFFTPDEDTNNAHTDELSFHAGRVPKCALPIRRYHYVARPPQSVASFTIRRFIEILTLLKLCKWIHFHKTFLFRKGIRRSSETFLHR